MSPPASVKAPAALGRRARRWHRSVAPRREGPRRCGRRPRSPRRASLRVVEEPAGAHASLVNEESMRSACIPAQSLFSRRPRSAAEASMVEQQHGQPPSGSAGSGCLHCRWPPARSHRDLLARPGATTRPAPSHHWSSGSRPARPRCGSGLVRASSGRANAGIGGSPFSRRRASSVFQRSP